LSTIWQGTWGMPFATTIVGCFAGSCDASKLGRSIERDDKLLEEELTP